MKNSTRIYFVDNLRGVLILLVILGHCIQNTDIDFDHNIIFRYIYAFHMPLFMYISGFVSYKTEYKWKQIGRRVLQLVIPFVAWAMLGMTLSTDFNWNWLVRPDNGLWFLWVLFWIGVLQILFSKLARKINIAEEYIFMTVCLVLLGVMVVNKLAFGFHLIAWYLPYYILGSLFRKYEVRLSPILDKSRLPLVVLYITGGYFWMRNEIHSLML